MDLLLTIQKNPQQSGNISGGMQKDLEELCLTEKPFNPIKN